MKRSISPRSGRNLHRSGNDNSTDPVRQSGHPGVNPVLPQVHGEEAEAVPAFPDAGAGRSGGEEGPASRATEDGILCHDEKGRYQDIKMEPGWGESDNRLPGIEGNPPVKPRMFRPLYRQLVFLGSDTAPEFRVERVPVLKNIPRRHVLVHDIHVRIP